MDVVGYSSFLLCTLFIFRPNLFVFAEPFGYYEGEAEHDENAEESSGQQSLAFFCKLEEKKLREEARDRGFVIIESEGQKIQTSPIAGSFEGLEGVPDSRSETLEGGENHDRQKRKVTGPLWPNAEVPYSFDKSPGKTWDDQSFVEAQVRKSISIIASATCIRFPEVAEGHEGNHILFQKGDSCRSRIGKVGRSGQSLTLLHAGSRSCVVTGLIMHEILHALGLIHEHARTDRDNYIQVNYPNIIAAKHGEYNIAASARNLAPYDLDSIMHYSVHAFAVSSSVNTMTVRNEALKFLPGQRDYLSFYDEMTLNSAYNCEGNCTNSCENDGYAFKDNQGSCVCRCPAYLTGDRCEQVKREHDCGGVFKLDNMGDVVTFGQNATDAKDSRECVWLVKGPNVLRVHFSMLALKIDGLGNCAHNLEVRSNLIGQRGPRLCGMTVPEDISTKDDHGIHSVMLIFREVDTMAYGGSFNLSVFASEPEDPCLSNPCHGRATCVYLRETTSFRCDCPTKFKGKLCEDMDVQSTLTADFEESFGFFENLSDDDFDWSRKTGSTSTRGTGPSGGFESPTYAYCEASYPRRTGHVAKLATPYLSLDNGRCLSFCLHMYGRDRDMGTLQILLEEDTAERGTSEIFKQNTNQNNIWNQIEINIPASPIFTRVIFKYTRNRAKGDIAIDNVVTHPGRCGEEPTIPVEDICECDFEDKKKPLCDCLSQSTTDKFDWTHLINSSTPSANTGPESASNKFGYLYFEASLPTIPKDNAILETAIDLPEDKEMCFRFSYNMHGNTIGLLRVSVFCDGEMMVIWSKDRNLGNAWFVGKVTIPHKTSKIFIEAVKGRNYRGDIAIDNVKLQTGRCTLEPCDDKPCFHTQDDACINEPNGSGQNFTCVCPPHLSGPTCDAVNFGSPAPARLSAFSTASARKVVTNFELDAFDPYGIFRQNKDDDFDWLIQRGPSGPSRSATGPKGAYEGQFYTYCEASSPNPKNGKAVLTSELIPGRSSYCLEFYYHMYGANMGSLRILIQREGNENKDLLWFKQGQQSANKNDWKFGRAEIPSTPQAFRIIIVGTLGNRDYRSDIALDIVVVKTGLCT